MMLEPPDLPAETIIAALRASFGIGAGVPSLLHRHGVPHVLAPVPTSSDAPYAPVDRFALALYPMLDAGTGAEVGLAPAQWRELGAALTRISTQLLRPWLAELEVQAAAVPPGDGGVGGEAGLA